MKLFFFNGLRSGISNALDIGAAHEAALDVSVTSLLIPEHALRVFYE
jgi:hypothetical protein